MNNATLLIGGNQGDRQTLIERATELIRQRVGTVVALSAVYETAPWGDFADARPQNFLNRALQVATPLAAHEVLEETQAIENELGRVRTPGRQEEAGGVRRYRSRPMDIDLIFFNDEVIDMPDLQVPHPRAHLRRFVLEPLAEIMPDYRHPTLHRTVRQLLADLG